MTETAKPAATPDKAKAGDSTYLSNSPALDKSSAEYKAVGDKFDKQFAEKIDLKYLEDVSKRLDNRFKVLVEFSTEIESSGTDMALFKNKLARDIVDLQNEIREAWNAIQILMNDRAKLRDLFIVYQLRFEKMKEQLRKLADTITERNIIIERLNALIMAQKADAQNDRDFCEKAKKSLADKEEELAKAKKDAADLAAEVARLNKILETYKVTNSKLTQEIDRLKNLLNQAERNLRDALRENGELKAGNRELANILERLKPEIDQLRKQNDELTNSNEALTEENRKLKRGTELLISEFEKLKNENHALFDRNTVLEKSDGDLKKENAALKDRVEDLEARNRELEDENAKNIRELAFLKDTYPKELSRLQEENRKLILANKDLKDQLRDLQNRFAALEAENAANKKLADDYKKQLDALLDEKRRRKEADAARPEPGLTMERSKKPVALTVLRKPKIKPFIELEDNKKTTKYTHYITHPCPYCMPDVPIQCPAHGGSMVHLSQIAHDFGKVKEMLGEENVEAAQDVVGAGVTEGGEAPPEPAPENKEGEAESA